MYFWKDVLDENTIKNADRLNTLLINKGGSFDARTERYCLLALNELDIKGSQQFKAKFQENIILSLEKRLQFISSGTISSEERAWSRYLLAHSYQSRYLEFRKEEDLAKSAFYNPNLQDRAYKRVGYTNDASLLGIPADSTEDFTSKYLSLLQEQNRDEEALDLLSEIAFVIPSDTHMKQLQDQFGKLNDPSDFKDYWKSFISKQGSAVPSFKDLNHELTRYLKDNSGKWILIDAWATWCQPCLKDLPIIQDLYQQELKATNNEGLSVSTFSFRSRNLDSFMEKKQYTFPVFEIEMEMRGIFEINEFPDKIIITPEGNYFKLPKGIDLVNLLNKYLIFEGSS